ncbi:HET-domain-containing protein [Stipitochalara longipes BDJ]|nr:HET-domain-containing protein [Stipitochalara longipes BDJ]
MNLLEDYQRDDEKKPAVNGQSEEQVEEELIPDEGEKGKKNAKDGEDHTKTSYEAVSWCWGREPADEILRVHDGDRVFAFPISKNLRMALWALRTNDEVRQLWIDAICINQRDVEERNQQVPRMDRIYGGAQSVCIWLGDATEDSKLAMDFIRDRVLELWTFDELIEDINLARHWAALITLMKRPWFSRRWVVQEIALSPRGGTIYCGKDHNSWQDFADAVSLFVEVESATHRLSDVMKLDQSFGNIPNFFGDVPSLGAALLVDATSNLFRNSMTGQRMPLSSLEYLVSRLSVFEAAQPRDTIYALLAISKETTPKNLDPKELKPEERAALQLAPKGGFGNTSYNVDYRLPVIDVYKEFIEFSISKSDKKRALDILCRPWAPTVMKSHDDPNFLKPAKEKESKREKQKGKKYQKWEPHKELESQDGGGEEEKDREILLPSWIPGLSGAAFEMEEHPTAGLHMERQNADPLVGLSDGSGRRNYAAAGDTELDKFEFKKWDTLRKPNSSYPEYSMFVRGFVLDEVATVEHLAANGNIPFRWLQAGGWLDTDEYPPDDFWRTLVADRAQTGQNPPTYFPRACKESMRYKAKTMSKAGGYVDCRKLIEEGRCTIVAQFLRRVQEVIWNRQLMRTKEGRLGLVRDDVSPGFKICILYGCSVPKEVGKRLFDASKRKQKEKVAQEVLKNLSYYRLVGESYLHGMMNGEAIALQNEGKLLREVFELR